MNHQTSFVAAAVALLMSAPLQAAVPGQFVAKLYTEALGRAPDAPGWANAMPYFQGNPCNQQTLALWGQSLFDSPEYTNIAYDFPAQVLVAYRAILNREPDPDGYSNQLARLQSGASTPSSMAAEFFASSEFAQLVPQICTGQSYSFGTTPAMRIPTPPSGGHDNLTGAQLQSLIDSAAPGSTIWLRQKSIVPISQTLVIRNGITLATYGSPLNRHHAYMARLVRTAPFSGAMVGIAFGGATQSGSLKSVWVDGQRNRNSSWVQNAINVEIKGGSNVVVSDNFFSNTLGWTSLQARGSYDNRACTGVKLLNNVVTSYPSRHDEAGKFTDGLSVGCENSTVTGNGIVDATDVGIVLFPAADVVQKSQVKTNTIVSAGNSAFAALGYDSYIPSSKGETVSDFTGAVMSGNTLWSSPGTHFIFGLTVGSRAWWGPNGLDGKGGIASNNTSAGIPTNVGIGVGVSGMLNATVQGNTINSVLIPQSYTYCPVGKVLASVSAGYASGTIQAYTDKTLFACISDLHPAQAVQP